MPAVRSPQTDSWIQQTLGVTPGAPTAKAAVFAKSRLAWVAARQKVEAELAKLGSAMSAVYDGHGAAADLEKAFQAKVEGMLDKLDHSLADKLDEVNNATDAPTHAKLVGEAKQIVKSYEDYVSSDPMIAKLDDNPFVPVAIAKTLTATLTALNKSIN